MFPLLISNAEATRTPLLWVQSTNKLDGCTDHADTARNRGVTGGELVWRP